MERGHSNMTWSLGFWCYLVFSLTESPTSLSKQFRVDAKNAGYSELVCLISWVGNFCPPWGNNCIFSAFWEILMGFKSFPCHMALPSLCGQDSGAAKLEALSVFFWGAIGKWKGTWSWKAFKKKKKELNSAGLWCMASKSLEKRQHRASLCSCMEQLRKGDMSQLLAWLWITCSPNCILFCRLN